MKNSDSAYLAQPLVSSQYDYESGQYRKVAAPPNAGRLNLATESGKGALFGLRDPFFLLLFLAHLAVVSYYAFTKGVKQLNEVDGDSGSDSSSSSSSSIPSGSVSKVGYVILLLASSSLVLSGLMLSYMVRNAETLIRTTLYFNVALVSLCAIVSFAYGIIVPGVIFSVFALLNWCYLRAVQSRIPFASANLKVACSAVGKHWTILWVSYGVVIAGIGWTCLWALASIGISADLSSSSSSSSSNDDGSASANDDAAAGTASGTSPSYGAVGFFLLLSFYWVHEVLRNVSHVTTSGVVASWWYDPSRTGVVSSSFFRASTTSLGSIAFGSLIVAFLTTLKSIAQEAERKGSSAACLARCILQCFERMMEYFNRWAFCYVGIYGTSFVTSGKAVFALFKQKGWTAIINDNLIQNTLSFAALIVACLMAGVGALLPVLTGSWLDSLQSGGLTAGGVSGVLAFLGFIIGFMLTSVMMAVVDSAVCTTFVCFAECPAALEASHPALYYDLTSAWRTAHGFAF